MNLDRAPWVLIVISCHGHDRVGSWMFGIQGICQLSDRRDLAASIAKKAPLRLLAMKSHMQKLNRVNKQRVLK